MSERPDRAPQPPPDAARGTGRTRAAGRKLWDPLWSAGELLGADHETVACFARRAAHECRATHDSAAPAHVTSLVNARGILEHRGRVTGGWEVRGALTAFRRL